MHAIIADWNEKGIQTRTGKYWRQATLRSIMLNRAMLGETVAGVIGWEPIIDAETFERLTALITSPSMKVRHSPGVEGGKYTMGGHRHRQTRHPREPQQRAWPHPVPPAR